MRFATLQVPKSDFDAADCQDAWCIESAKRRYVVADGVTQSVYAKAWARIVADGICALEDVSPRELVAGIPQWREAWRESVPKGPLPWNIARKLHEVGAYSTIAVLELQRVRGRGRFRVVAVGDSCVFQIRDDRLIYAFPYTSSSAFGQSTHAIGSLPGTMGTDLDAVMRDACSEGERRTRDRFIVASDALAEYLLKGVALGAEGVRAALPFRRTAQEFQAWVDDRRRAGDLDDDDTTFLEVAT